MVAKSGCLFSYYMLQMGRNPYLIITIIQKMHGFIIIRQYVQLDILLWEDLL